MATRPDQDPEEARGKDGRDGRDGIFIWDGPTAPWTVNERPQLARHLRNATMIKEMPRVQWMINSIETAYYSKSNSKIFRIPKSNKVTKDDLSAFLAAPGLQSQIPSSQLPPNSQAGTNDPLQFVCRSPSGCKCSPPLPSEGLCLYQELPSSDHLRILEILPGSSGIVECKLHVGRLPEDKNTYEALSYTWDLEYRTPEDDSTLSIRCNGLDVPVGINLANALRRLRKKHVSRMVWADALCINQMDIAEKSQQVSRMSLIYQNASQVVIWLGETYQVPPHYPYQAFSGVCAVVNAWRERSGHDTTIPVATHSPGFSEPPEESWNMSKFVSGARYRRFKFGDGPLSVVEVWGRIFEIYSRRWFSRLWVIQEVALARSAIVLWDDCEISWEWIGLAAAIIRTNYDAIAAALESHRCTSVRGNMHAGVINCYLMFRLSKSQRYISPIQLTFYELLKLTRQFGCQDDRDRVYGLLGLPAADDLSRTLTPDYSKSVKEVYCLVAKRIIDLSASLAVLSSVQRDEYRVQFDTTMPSWVPQWNVLLTRSLALPHGVRVAASSAAHIQRQNTYDPLKLTLRGVLVDCVVNYVYSEGSEFGPVLERFPEPDAGDFVTEDEIQNINDPLKTLLQDPDAAKIHLQKVSLTLTAGQDWYGFPVQDVLSHLADYVCCILNGRVWWSLERDAFAGSHRYFWNPVPSREEKMALRHLARRWNLEAKVKTGNPQRFLNAAATLASQRVRFTTSSGMIGIGPQAMQQDDLLCILYGATVPFVIRRRSDGPGYILIGECYVYDLMAGDAVKHLDALPSGAKEAWIELH